MLAQAVRLVGRHAVKKAVAHQARRQGIDLKLGFALFRDKRVPRSAKFVAVVLGLVAMVLLNVIELPAEAFVAIALPLIGVPFDLAFNGIENVIGPVLLSAFFLTLTAPKGLVQRIHNERAGIFPSSEMNDVIDVESRLVDNTP